MLKLFIERLGVWIDLDSGRDYSVYLVNPDRACYLNTSGDAYPVSNFDRSEVVYSGWYAVINTDEDAAEQLVEIFDAEIPELRESSWRYLRGLKAEAGLE